VNEGALLAISRELMMEIKNTCSNSANARHSELAGAILRIAERKGSLWFIDDLPVFVEPGIATDPFAIVGTVVIQLFEAESSNQWMEYLLRGEFQANGNSVGVRKLNDVSRDIIRKTKIIKEGDPWDGVRRLLKVPMMWSQRIILYDQYALKNARASRLPNRGDISGLDRFLECLVEVRRECDMPLDELTIITHRSPTRTASELKMMQTIDSNVSEYVRKEEQLEAMGEICSYHELHDWVKEVKLVFSKIQSAGDRYIIFEYSQNEQCFVFGTKGLVSIDAQHSGDPIKEQFVIKGPLQNEEWQPFKDKLKTFTEHVIESAS
jgi:hypothetical protein